MDDLVSARARLAWPGQCAICHAWPAQPVCTDCLRLYAVTVKRCRICAVPLDGGPATGNPCPTCRTAAPAFCRALAAVRYAYPWANLLHDFKFHGAIGWARHFAALLGNIPELPAVLQAADYLLPMPLSPARMRERGYNQASLLAQALATAKVRTNLLLRVRDTPAQSTLALKDRLPNVLGAYAVAPLQRAAVQGSSIVLLDDVMTSGASLNAAATALLHAGAHQVCAVAFARAD